MKKIALTQGKYALVDDEDYKKLSEFKWFARRCGNTFYAGRNKKRVGGKRGMIHMHRVIMNPPKGKMIDHRDRNGLNNQKNNLRICTNGENVRNTGVRRNNRSGFTGVDWYKPRKLWRARILNDWKETFLGYFVDKLQAVKAYNDALKNI